VRVVGGEGWGWRLEVAGSRLGGQNRCCENINFSFRKLNCRFMWLTSVNS